MTDAPTSNGTGKSTRRERTTRGFERTSKLLGGRIRAASESRGFAQSRLLTHWEEIAGTAIAAICRPVEVSYGRQGFGATLTLLTTGANAPMLEMQKEQLREKVNAAYGYAAISRIRLTQTAPTGFSEGQAQFAPRTPETAKPDDPQIAARAHDTATGIQNDDLRAALEALAANVFTKNSQKQ
ncbi:DUF721 domain-containing protein [Maritimibacter sp. DP1N21-5]|uniref:DUF721 domain-containing protein n=1 Tax=Maritimibacter sp. DP1N21-5 TaxID=2836867 RepID=UPI00351D3532